MKLGYFKKFGLPEVINAAGRLTILGASTMDMRAAKAMAEASQSYVMMEDLKKKAGEMIAEMTGAESAFVTSGAAAGIVISTAACMTGSDLTKIQRLPDTEGLKNEVIIQKGHVMTFGASVTQMVRLSGAKVVEVGVINWVRPEDLEGAICEKTAAILHVLSPMCVQRGMLALEEVIKIAKRHKIPVIVDAAAELDLKKYIAAGADLVMYSGGKEINGPSCTGIIIGRKDLVEACTMQEYGIARCMKVSKETIAGLITALEILLAKDTQMIRENQRKIVQYFVDKLKDIPHTKVSQVEDEAGRPIVRAQISLDEKALGVTASDIVEELEKGDPIIKVRYHFENRNILTIDPRPLKDGQEKIIVSRLRKLMK